MTQADENTLAADGESDAVFYVDNDGNRFLPIDPLEEYRQQQARSAEMVERYKRVAFGTLGKEVE